MKNQNSIQRTTPSKRRTKRSEDDETNGVTLAPGDYLAGTPFKAPTPEDDPYSIFGVRWSNWIGDLNILRSPNIVRLPEIRLSSRDVTRWKMAWRAMQAFRFPEFFDDTKFGGTNAITLRCKDWPNDIVEDLSVALGFSAAAFIYGGLHVLAWFAHFNSSTEQVLWRISACLVMGGLPVMYVLMKAVQKVLESFPDRIYIPWERTREVSPSKKENWFSRKKNHILIMKYLKRFIDDW